MEGTKYTSRKLMIAFLCLVEMFLALGLIFGFSVMYADLTIVFNLTRLKSATIQGVYNLISLGGGIIWTWPIKKIGFGLSLVLASFIGCVGFLLSSLAKSYEIIVVCTGLITGSGLSLGFLAPFAIVGAIFEEPGFHLALVTLSGSLGQTLFPYIYEIFLIYYHWSGAFILLAGIALQGIPCGLFIHYSKRLIEKNGEDNSSKTSNSVTWIDLLTDYAIWLCIFITLVMFATINFAPWFLVDQMVSLGYSQHFGSFLLTLLGCANVFARIIGSILNLKLKRVPAIYNMFYVCPLQALAHALILILQSRGNLLIAACIVYGFSYGFFVVMLPVIAFDLFGSEKFQKLFTLVCLSMGVATILGNFIGGTIRDASGDYDVAYKLGIVISLLVMICYMALAFIKTKRQRNIDKLLHNGNVKKYTVP